MRKVFFGLFVLSLVAVGFFMGTMSENKAYALFGGGADDCLNCDVPELTKPPLRDEEIRQWNADLIKENSALRIELDAYKALETFWAEEVLRRDNSLQGAWLKSISESCKDPKSYRCWGGHEEGM